MARFTTADQSRLQSVRERLGTFEIGAQPALSWFAGELRELTGARSVMCHGLRRDIAGPRLDFAYYSGQWPSDLTAVGKFVEEKQTNRERMFDPSRPEPGQRNVVVTLDDLAVWSTTEKVRMGIEEYLSRGIDINGQVRVLLCERSSLLAFVAALNTDNESRTRRLLANLVPALRRRLSLERLLQHAPLAEAALTATLEAVGGAAFLVNAQSVVHANSSGRALMDSDSRVALELLELANHRRTTLDFDVTRLEAAGLPQHYLVILRGPAEDTRPRAAMLALRWHLTSRQQEVLQLIAVGQQNRTIAAELRCAERTIEQHVQVLLERSQTSCRAELVARFWTAR